MYVLHGTVQYSYSYMGRRDDYSTAVRVQPGGFRQGLGCLLVQQSTLLLPGVRAATVPPGGEVLVRVPVQYRPGGITGTKYSYSYDLGTTPKRATRGILMYEYSYEYSTVYAVQLL